MALLIFYNNFLSLLGLNRYFQKLLHMANWTLLEVLNSLLTLNRQDAADI